MNDFFGELKDILSRMDVPERRTDDMRWLMRNLGVRNSDHPEFNRAIELVKKIDKQSVAHNNFINTMAKIK